MSQRDSGYERKERDLYETPPWATEALLPHIPDRLGNNAWEPACATGKMVRVLNERFVSVLGTDIDQGRDFLKERSADGYNAIITNPPYALAQEFIEHALNLMKYDGFVAMLLRTDFDHAKGRRHLFNGCRAFAKKIVLVKRIQWFEDSTGSPSFNHAWFIWDWKHSGYPELAYGPPDAMWPDVPRQGTLAVSFAMSQSDEKIDGSQS